MRWVRGGSGVAVVVVFLLTGCTTSPVSSHFDHGVLAAESDVGDSGARAAVRAAVGGALSDEDAAFDVDRAFRGQSPASLLAAVTAPDAVRRRGALLARARSGPLAADLQRSFVFYARQEFGPTWSGTGTRTAWLDRDVRASGSFHVDQWQGVQVEGSTARVLVRGEDRGVSWGGSPRSDVWAQYKLILHADPTAPHGWRVIHEQAATTAP